MDSFRKTKRFFIIFLCTSLLVLAPAHGQVQLRDIGRFITKVGGRINADRSMVKSLVTAALGVAMGTAYMRQCKKPFGQWACPLAAMSFLDAAKAGANAFNSLNFGSSLRTGGSNDSSSQLQGTNEVTDQARAGLEALENRGYVIDPITGVVTASTGEEYTAADYASAAALEQKGFDSEQARGILGQSNQIQQGAFNSLAENEEQLIDKIKQIAENNRLREDRNLASVNGGAFSDSGSSGGLVLIDGYDLESGQEQNGDRIITFENMDKAQSLKYTKDFKGTPVALPMVDLFYIVQDQYQQEDKNNSFLVREH